MNTPLLDQDSVRLLTKRWGRMGMVFASFMLLSFAAYAQPMSGTYTVCAGGTCDYSTVKAAVTALNSNGVSGPVVFDIKSGTYKENSISIGSGTSGITGASATNTITFKGAGKNSTLISDAYAGYIIRVYYSKYINFENLTIDNQTTSSGQALYIYYSQYTGVQNCNITMKAGTTYYGSQYPLYTYYSSRTTIEDSRIFGGYYAAYIYGSPGSSTYGYDTLKNNEIKGSYYYCIYNYGGYNSAWIGNTLDSSLYGAGAYSFYTNGYLIEKNIVPGNNIGGLNSNSMYYGLMLYYMNYYNNSNDYIIQNNIIGPNIYYYGLYAYVYYVTNSKVKIRHNTVVMSPNAYASYGAGYFYTYQTTGGEYKNNLFYSQNSTSALYWYYFDGGSTHLPEGNAYYSASGNALTIQGTSSGTFKTVDDFKKAYPNVEKWGSSVKPTFKSATDLHLDQSSPAPSGYYAGVDKDIDGDSRCLLFPTAGADESNYGKGAFKAQFFVPSIVYEQSPVVFYNFAKPGEPKVHRWYVDGVYITDSVHLASALSSGSHVVSLATEGCAGSDSIAKTVTVVTPPVVPASDFIADQNIFPQGEMVRFSDLSTYGPSKWKWEITPEQTYVGGVLTNRYKYLYGTNDSSQNPVVQFTASGKYKVCLTATNTKGDGNQECKVDYIEVTPQINMGEVSETNASQGILFDSGGPNGEALTGGKTKLLINACASDVYLVFDMFDMMCGYNYLRIYDGEVEDDAYALHPCTSNASNYGSTGLTGGTGYPYCNGNNLCMPELTSSATTDTFHAKSGKMLIVQDINYPYGPYGYTPGFKASWWSTPKTFSPPVAGFEVDTTVCQNGLLTFKNTSTGDDNKYNWDLDGDLQTFEATDKDETQWLFTIPGKQTVTLIANNCGGIDTFTQVIDVFVPNKPNIAFTSSNSSPTPADVVFVTSDITECVDDYEWTFARSSGKAGTVTYMNNTSKFSENPQVMFSDTGCWDATLVATNAGGTSTLKKTCFVNVKESYCVPSVATMSKDVGISEVAIMASADSSDLMRNTSSQGVKDYSNYVNDIKLATGLEIGVTYLVEVKRTSNANAVTRNIWIDWNLDGDFNDPQEEVAVETNAKTTSWIATVTVPIIAKTGASVMRIAINTGQFSNEVCGQNRFGEYEDYRVEISNDKTPPVVTLYGADGTTPVESGDTIVIEQGRMFTEWGFKAIDNLDGDITSNVTSDTMALPNGPSGTLNTFVVRNYKISYIVQDATGNQGSASRIIKVIEDSTAPTLTISGTDTIRHNVDDATFTMPQVVTVNDIVDGIQVNMETKFYNDGVEITAVDPTVVDTYTVVFTATDAAGNMTMVTRVVIVEDITDPTLTLIGSNPVEHQVLTPYTDEKVTPSDNYWTAPRLDEGLTVTNNVDENKIGTYTVEYTLTDPSGNGPVTAVRTVNVVDKIAPVAMVEAEDTIVWEVNTKFDYPTATYDDNYYTMGDLTTEWLGTLTDNMTDGMPNMLGDFTLQFVVTDPSNNVTTVERIVRVGDFTAPDIELEGEPSITICRWEEYVDEGYTMEDNYYENSTITVTEEGSYNTQGGSNLPGLYTYRYKAVDGSNNIGYSSYRTILVKSENEYPCYTNGIEDAASLEKMVNVYPNPSTGNFTVKVGLETQQQLRISVMNLLGEELMIVNDGQVLSDVYNVDLSNRASGVYLLKVQGADFSFTKRLVIQK